MIRAGTRNRNGMLTAPLMCLATQEIGGVPLDCEAFAQSFAVTITDTLGLSDTTSAGPGVTVIDPMGLVDDRALDVGSWIVDQLGLVDDRALDLSMWLIDPLGLTDTLDVDYVVGIIIDCLRQMLAAWNADADVAACGATVCSTGWTAETTTEECEGC